MKPWRELFFEEVEPPHHFHIGMRIIKTVIAVFVCAIIGWLRGEMTFFSMIAAVLLVLITTVGSIVRHKRAVRPAGKHGK